MIKGKQSIAFEVSPYLEESASVVGKKEGEGPLGGMFDMVAEEDLFGENTWEEAESTMQKEACLLALGKAHLAPESIRYLFGGDLLRQGVATSMGVETLQIPMFGLYGACSTSGEALALASMSVAAGYGERMLAVTSSHFGSAEKEFRFPLGYANQRPLSAHWTVTGSGAFIVGKNRSHVRITGVTVGKIVDYGLKDSQNMGACMAPAACDTIIQNLEDFDQEGIREMTKPLFSIPPHQFLFNAGSIDKRSYMEMLQLDEAEYNLIKFPQRGVCLYKCGNERYLLEVHAPTYKEKLFGTAGGR